MPGTWDFKNFLGNFTIKTSEILSLKKKITPNPSNSFNSDCGFTEIDVTETPDFTLPCYLNNMHCTYTITGDGREIQLSFGNFRVEYDSYCDYDWVEVSSYYMTTLRIDMKDASSSRFELFMRNHDSK